MNPTDALVVFTPSGRRGRFPLGTPLLQAARALGVDIDSVCGGRGLCGRCQVVLTEGEFAKHGVTSRAAHLSPFGAVEREFDRSASARRRAAACPARRQILGDVVIDVPPESQVHRQVVRKFAEARDIELDPVVRLHYVEVQPPDMHDPSGDLRRLEDALEFEWRLTGLACDVRVLQQLQPALRQGGWKVTVAVHGGKPDHRRVAGLSRARLRHRGRRRLDDDRRASVRSVERRGRRRGRRDEPADPLRRGSDEPRLLRDDASRRRRELTDTVRAAINDLVAEVARTVGIEREEILEATFVGNPIMHHLLLGISPVELGGAPFALSTDASLTLWATEIDLAIHRNARIYVLPCIAGHVGADAAGVVLAERPDLSEEVTLLVDVGTNAEIVLGSQPAAARVLEPDGSRIRGRADQLAGSGRPRAPSSACGSIAGRWSRASRSSAATCGRTNPDSPRPPPRPASPASAARASSR